MRKSAEQSGKALHFRSYVSSFDAAYRLVQFGLGLAVFPQEAVSRYAALFDLRVIALTDDWALGEFVICMRDRHTLSLSARRLLDHLLLRAPAWQVAADPSWLTMDQPAKHVFSARHPALSLAQRFRQRDRDDNNNNQ